MRVFILALGLLSAGAAQAEEVAESPDRLEGFNRAMFATHMTLDRAIFAPAAKAYRVATPGFLRDGVRNALGNLEEPANAANNLLQAKPVSAGQSLVRFGLNTTLGLGGIVDVATSVDIEERPEDFGQTLAVWGVPSGPYLFLPGLGPTTVRDLLGRVADRQLDPLVYANGEDADTGRTVRRVVQIVSLRESALDALDELSKTSPDLYESVKRYYLRSRLDAINDGAQDFDTLPDFEASPVAPTVPEAPVAPEGFAADPLEAPDLTQPHANPPQG